MSDFLVIPAIDIKSGKCVRLLRGRPEDVTVFSEDPVAVAAAWEEKGAAMLHVVDLDGAFEGTPVNRRTVLQIARAVGIPLQVGGGIRNLEAALHYLDGGVARVVMGTGAFESGVLDDLTSALGERLVVGLDVKDGRVAVCGWTETTGTLPLEALEYLVRAGVKRVVYTDVSKDGTLQGPNLEGIRALALKSQGPLIAAGGVSRLEDIGRLAEMEALGVEGVIVGMALYRGSFTLEEAILAAGGKA